MGIKPYKIQNWTVVHKSLEQNIPLQEKENFGWDPTCQRLCLILVRREDFHWAVCDHLPTFAAE